MALSYYLDASTEMKPAQAMEKLAGHMPRLSWTGDRWHLVDPTITIRAAEPVASTSVKEAFHFTPTLTVGFRFATNTDYDAFKETMLRATMLLLEHARDAVLLFNGEIIVLQWFDGKLVFNSEYHIFDDDDWLKTRLTLPYERRPLPSPLL